MRYLRVLYSTIVILLIPFNNCCTQPNVKSTVIEEKGAPAQNNYSGTTYAIIVGISSYHYIKSLTYADKDAELFKEFLMSLSGGSVKDSNIIMLLNEKATSTNFYLNAIGEWIAQKNFKAGDKLYIYFSGHGDARDNREYHLLTYDTKPDQNNYRATGTIRMYELKNTIADITEKGVKTILIIDACRTDDLPTNPNKAYNYNGITETRVGELLLLSASGGQKSIEDRAIGNGHGLFTWNLIDGLNGRADAELLGNKDGVVTYGELGTWLKITVATTASDKYHNEQVPTFYDVDSKFSLAKVDSSYYSKWMLAKSLNSGSGNDVAMNDNASGKKGGGGKTDSSALLIYNDFLNAMKKNILTGTKSAEMFYDSLQKIFPGQEVTNDARYQLASAFIDFGQEKINLHVSGKENKRTVETLKNQIAGEKENSVLSESVLRMERVVNEKFTQAGYLMEKGINLLKNSNPIYLNGLRAKAKFLKAKGYYEAEPGNALTLTEAKQMAYEARTIDPEAAYINYLLGLLLALDYKPDSAVYYEHLASLQAPNWAYPLNQLGREFEKKFNYDSAIVYYKKAIETDYNFIDSYNNLAIVFKGIGKYDSAETYCRRGIKLDPEYIYLYCNLADVMKETKRYDSAERIYKKAIAINPRYIYPYNNLGISFDNQHKYDSALKYYKLALDIDPNYSYSLSNIASAYREMKSYDSAFKYYRKAIALNPESAYDLNGIGIIFYNQKIYDSAITYYKKAYEADPTYKYSLYNIGLIYYDQNKFDSSKNYHLQTIKVDPQYISSYNYLGLCYEKLNQPDSAFYYYRKAIGLNKDYHYAYYNIGYLYQTKTKYDSAEYYLKMAHSINPKGTGIINSLGYNYELKLQYDSAAYYYSKLPGMDTSYINPSDLNKIGLCYYNAKQNDSAMVYYRLALKKDPQYPYSLNNIGLIFSQQLKFDSALVYYFKSLAANSPLVPNLYNNIGYTYQQLKKYDSSLYYLRKCLSADPGFASAYYNLGYTYELKGMLDSAIYNNKKYLSIAGPDAKVNMYIAMLYEKQEKSDSALVYYKNYYNMGNAGGAYYIGNIYYGRSKFDSSIFYYEKTYDFYKDSSGSTTFERLGYSYLRKNGLDKSLYYFNAADRLYHNANTKYNLCCYYSLAGDKPKALDYFEQALKNNFTNFDHIQIDKDLDPIRQEAKFIELLKQYFPDKYK
ncbi:MAG: tetratricopeptide repeat protein [Sphingobacteriales bacterium]|nr:tetratricopeptide repeat protein [Sphingobacteriales bacterium]